MALTSIKKILLTGTALVAVSLFSTHAYAADGVPAADGIDEGTTNAVPIGAETGTAGALSGTPATDPGIGAAGGAGIGLTNPNITVTDNGNVTGGQGQDGPVAAGTGNTGGAGGAGFNFSGKSGTSTSATTSFVTSGITQGGGGGSGSAGAATFGGGAGGNGGAGVFDNADFSSVTGSGTNMDIVGGSGGNGGNGTAAGPAAGGNGGIGGDGITISGNSATADYSGTLGVSAGNGGNGGLGVGAAASGNGGNGGAAYNVSGNTATLTITERAVGGNGGTGGAASGATGTAGNGGNGGDAILLGNTGATVDISNSASITGGAGGAAGAANGGTAGTDGNGGNAITISGTGNTVTIGAGSTLTGGLIGGPVGNPGASGTGILISGATGNAITNAGLIFGGNGGIGAAIRDTGSTDTTTISNLSTGIIGTTASGDGIDIAAGKTLTSLDNAGTIETTSGIAVNIAGTAALTTLTNSSGAAISATTGTAVFDGGTLATLSNAGTISTGTGIALDIENPGTTTFSNTGTITASGVNSVAIKVAADIGALGLTSTGTISNTYTLDNNGIALELTNAAGQTGAFINTGTISSPGTGGNTGKAVVLTGTAGVDFRNSGTVTGTITNTGNDLVTLVNSGAGAINGAITITGTGASTLDTLGTSSITGNVGFTGNATHTLTFASTSANELVGNLTGGAGTDNLTVSAGTLSGGTIDLGGGNDTIALSGGTIASNITNASNGNETVTLTGSLAITGTVDLGTGTNTITVGDGTTTTAFTTGNTITTGGTITTDVKDHATFGIANNYTAGAGTLTVETGSALNVTGASAVVSSGAFNNSGTSTFGGTSTTTVGGILNHAGGILDLTGGTLNNTSISNTGTINLTGSSLTTPGALDSSGTINISAGRTLTTNTFTTDAGIYGFEIKGGTTTTNGTNGQLVSTASAVDLSTSTIKVRVNPANYVLSGSVYDVVTGTGAAGGATGTPVDVGTANGDTAAYKFYTVNGTYAGGTLNGHNAAAIGGANTDIYIIASQNPVSALGSAITTNDAAVYNTLLAIGGSGNAALNTVQGAVAAAPTSAALHSVLSSLTPAVDGGARMSALQIGTEIEDITDTRMDVARADDGLTGMAAGSESNGNSIWFQGYGQHAAQSESDTVAGYTSNTFGGAIGLDTVNLFDSGIVGLAVNYAKAKVDSNNTNTTTTDVDNYGLTLYSAFALEDRMFLDSQFGYAHNKIDSVRHNVNGPGSGVSADGSTNASQYDARFELGHDYTVGWGTVFTPDVMASYDHLNTAGYSETGSGANLTVASNSLNALDLGIGGKMTWKIKNYDGSLMKPMVHASYAYDFIDDGLDTTSTFSGAPGSPAFITTGPTPSHNIFDVGAGVIYLTAADWDLSANYDYEYRSIYRAHTGIARATAHF